MERTLLFQAYQGTDESPNLQFKTIQGASILLGGGEGFPDRETPRTPRVYRQQLERILRKWWAVMTSGIYRMEIPGTDRLDPYHKIRGV